MAGDAVAGAGKIFATLDETIVGEREADGSIAAAIAAVTNGLRFPRAITIECPRMMACPID